MKCVQCLLLLSACFQVSRAMECSGGQVLFKGDCVCPPGTYGEASCLECPPGSFNPGFGARDEDFCRPCLENTFQDKSGKAQCSPCPLGKNAGRGFTTCHACGPGSSVNPRGGGGGMGCIPCSEGTYSNDTSNLICEQCPWPQTGPSGSDSIAKCFGCPPGQFGRSCQLCNDGTFKSGTAGLCLTCPSGTFSRDGASKCKPCRAGRYPLFGRVGKYIRWHCALCPPRTTSAKASDVCRITGESCPPRYFENRHGGCQTCKEGFFFQVRKRRCERCPIGSVSRGGMQTRCEFCTDGLEPDSNNRLCRCPEGYSFGEDGKCEPCPAGWRSNSISNIIRPGILLDGCIPCFAGSFSNKPGQARCELCPFPLVAPNEGATSCEPCPVGAVPDTSTLDERETCVSLQTGCAPGYRYKYFFGAFCEAVRCPPDTPEKEIGVACIGCPPGSSYVVINGKSKCEECPFDEYAEAGSYGPCKKCPNGRVRSLFDGSKCTCNGEGKVKFGQRTGMGLVNGVCQKCPRGSFGPSNVFYPSDDESCKLCPPGTFANKNGTFFCTECPFNSFANKAGAVKCKPCPEGMVGHPHFRSVKCITAGK